MCYYLTSRNCPKYFYQIQGNKGHEKSMKTGCYCYAVKQCQRSWNPLVRYVRIHVNNAKLFSFFTKKCFKCSLNADLGGKKRFQVMYINKWQSKKNDIITKILFVESFIFLRNKKLFHYLWQGTKKGQGNF